LDDEHVPALDVDVEVLQDPDDARRVGRCAVAGDRHEVDLARNAELAHQVGHEEDRSLQHADKQEIPAGVVVGDLGAELGDPSSDDILLDEHLRDTEGELGHRHSRVASMPGASTIPGTATTSSPRTTRGHSSLSERGIFASTKTSWIFFERPA